MGVCTLLIVNIQERLRDVQDPGVDNLGPLVSLL
jgi:hypothetical protein